MPRTVQRQFGHCGDIIWRDGRKFTGTGGTKDFTLRLDAIDPLQSIRHERAGSQKSPWDARPFHEHFFFAMEKAALAIFVGATATQCRVLGSHSTHNSPTSPMLSRTT